MRPICQKCGISMDYLHDKNGGKLFECPECDGTVVINPQPDRRKKPMHCRATCCNNDQGVIPLLRLV